jgi:uncharacterized membrane protein
MSEALFGQMNELWLRVAGMEGRLGAVEKALGMSSVTYPAGETNVTAHLAPPPPLPVDNQRIPPVRVADVEMPYAIAPVARNVGPRKAGIIGGWSKPAAVAKEAAKDGALESMIGRNWTSWVGAIVVVLGVLFFLKYAWDQGWLTMSPAMRVASAIGAGLAFGVAGEWLYRRAMRGLAAAVTGAGVAIVMGAFLAGHSMFEEPIFSAKVAAAGVCAAAAAGISRALRINAVSLAIIALLGAYLAPAVLRSGRDESLTLMGYLAVLGGVGWALSYLKPQWNAMRWLVWVCTGLWMAVWVIRFPMQGAHQGLALGMVAYFFAGFMGEAFLTIRRAFRVVDEGAAKISVVLENSLSMLSMLTTAGAFGVFFVLLDPSSGAAGLFHMQPTVAVALGFACVHGMIARATPSKQFARSSLLQGAALVTIAVPLMFGQAAITLAWMVLCVALAALGWRRDMKAVRVWAVVLLGLALGRLFVFDWADGGLRSNLFAIGEHGVSRWLLMAVGMAVVAHVIGWLMSPWVVNVLPATTTSRGVSLGAVLAGVGTLAFFVATGLCWGGVALTLIWIGWAGGLAAMVYVRGAERLDYLPHAAAAVFVAALRWIALDGLRPIAASWDQPGTIAPVVNLVAFAGVLLIGLVLVVGRRLSADMKGLAPIGAAVLGFATLNFETLRAVDYCAGNLADFVTAKLVALSVLWALVGLGAVLVGFARRVQSLRYAALGLLGVTLLKILFVDLAQVRPAYRILSFLAVGGLLLCVSFVYHRQSGKRRVA